MHVTVTLISIQNAFYQSSHFEELRAGLSLIERCDQALGVLSCMPIGIPSSSDMMLNTS